MPIPPTNQPRRPPPWGSTIPTGATARYEARIPCCKPMPIGLSVDPKLHALYVCSFELDGAEQLLSTVGIPPELCAVLGQDGQLPDFERARVALRNDGDPTLARVQLELRHGAGCDLQGKIEPIEMFRV